MAVPDVKGQSLLYGVRAWHMGSKFINPAVSVIPGCLLLPESNRHVLVDAGAISVFVQLLESSDEDIQFYSAAALSNLAVHGMCVSLRHGSLLFGCILMQSHTGR